jgi:hypothetical protein
MLHLHVYGHAYIYKADHPRCKLIGLRFLSCFFLSKKKASTGGVNISVWGLLELPGDCRDEGGG